MEYRNQTLKLWVKYGLVCYTVPLMKLGRMYLGSYTQNQDIKPKFDRYNNVNNNSAYQEYKVISEKNQH